MLSSKVKYGKLEKYSGKQKRIRIPDGVRAIAEKAFNEGNTIHAALFDVEEIIFPESLTEIKFMRFSWSRKLKRITLPDGLRIIDVDAFNGCGELEELIIPNSVSVIGSGAFCGCNGIKKLRISDSPQKIVKNAFYGDRYRSKPDWFVRDWEIEIVSIFSDEISKRQLISALRYDNLAYTFLRGKLHAGDDYIKLVTKWLRTKANRKTIVDAAIERNDHQVIDRLFRLGLKFTNSEIDEYVKSSNSGGRVELTAVILSGFNYCKTMKKNKKKDSDEEKTSDSTNIVLPNNLKEIQRGVFCDCKNLVHISIPNTVTSIDGLAFYGCTNLDECVLPNGIEKIEDSTFYDCKRIEKITIPISVRYIGHHAFKGCEKVIIEGDLGKIEIEQSAFSGCKVLQPLFSNHPKGSQ